MTLLLTAGSVMSRPFFKPECEQVSVVGGPLCVHSSVCPVSKPNNKYWPCLGPTH